MSDEPSICFACPGITCPTPPCFHIQDVPLCQEHYEYHRTLLSWGVNQEWWLDWVTGGFGDKVNAFKAKPS